MRGLILGDGEEGKLLKMRMNAAATVAANKWIMNGE
jgi:hypothetical protein